MSSPPISASTEEEAKTVTLNSAPSTSSNIVDPIRKSQILADVDSSLDKLSSSDFFRRFLSQFDTYFLAYNIPKSLPNNHYQLVAYNLGSISSSSISRLHLSFAILLLRRLPSPLRPQIHHPLFDATECAALEHLGFTVLPLDDFKPRVVEETHTLFYLPCVELSVLNNLLDVNWIPENLLKMTILGDTLRLPSDVCLSFFERMMEAEAPYVLAGAVCCTSKEVDSDEEEEKDGEEIRRAFDHHTWTFFQKQQLEMWNPEHLPFRNAKTPTLEEST